MKRYRALAILMVFLALCGGVVWLILRGTAQYPSVGTRVSYPVNQIEGFDLSIEAPTWSPFRGYTVRYEIAIDSEDVYFLGRETYPFEHLEQLDGGRWHRLVSAEEGDRITFEGFSIGGEDNTGFAGSVVQKYAGYGTRLEPGTYRLTLELTDAEGTPHYLAAEFEVD